MSSPRTNEPLQQQAAPPAQAPSVAARAPTFDAAEGSKLFAGLCAAVTVSRARRAWHTSANCCDQQVANANHSAEHISTMLRGLSGKAVNGRTNKVEMPPFADKLSDRQIAEIIGHERTS
jgi:mono/diheme cytochrome c family protein